VLLVRVLVSRAYPVPVAEATSYLQDIAARLGNKGLDVRREVLLGGTARKIAELAQATPNNIIALASHGRSGIARWVMGSLAEELLRASGDPVLVIPSALAGEG
jgi:nucleotide-binding universal stress UspA family protein